MKQFLAKANNNFFELAEILNGQNFISDFAFEVEYLFHIFFLFVENDHDSQKTERYKVWSDVMGG